MTTAHPADAGEATQLLATENRRIRALLDGDVATLDELFDDSLVHIHAPGLVQDKAKLLEHVAVRRAYRSIERGELTMRVAGDVAVVTGTITNRLATAEGGERTVEGVATQVLVRADDGTWRYLSFQMTPFTEQAWGALPSEHEQAAENRPKEQQ
ncbi:nuclear transport factor 2 family protein [Subtercola sp. YIM 133946]|uniref:nuclear transport factor 2 family protein n=1 Tax=Subtercola sp. YIM 133946 TaxID=3118909 RepID=UPI002F92979E